jgi:hypothetical protein
MGKSVFAIVKGFLGKYAVEAAATASAIDDILTALPLSAGDKENIREKLSVVFNAGSSIEAALSKLTEPTPVKISKADIEAAVRAVLPALVKEAVEDALSSLTAPAANDGPDAAQIAAEAKEANGQANEQGSSS